MAETDLYLPVKRHLEAQGYVVKAEVRGCDVMAVRGDETPVIVELKAALTLKLLYQAMERLTVSDHVYIAVARPRRGVGASALQLCRRLGVGALGGTSAGAPGGGGGPGPPPYAPRANSKKRELLLKEFNARSGDPNMGGSTRTPLMTAYRQDALRCAGHLAVQGPARIRDVKAATAVDRAAGIFRDNVYGWFEKVDRGIYALSPAGQAAVIHYGGAASG